MTTDHWRIDDLAHETGVTVDTIRYYQRQGLLPPGDREGRHRVYGPEHVRRLRRIKELQARRFSIAAIHALVSGGNERLEELLADHGEDLRLSLDDLVERTGASRELVAALQEAGVLLDPHDFGRTAYDGDDLEMLRNMVRVVDAGTPIPVLGEIARIYAEGIEETQRRIVSIFVSDTRSDLEPDDIERVRTITASDPSLIPLMRRLVDYTHHRTIQRLTLDAVQPDPYPDPDAVDPDATEELLVLPDASGRGDDVPR